MLRNSKPTRGFSLVELIISVSLIGGVLAMIAGAVYILDKRVANERLIIFPTEYATDAQLSSTWGYSSTGTGAAPVAPKRPNYTLAPSRIADAQAESLWRQMQEIYEQSYAVTGINAYINHNFVKMNGTVADPTFIGASGYLTPIGQSTLTKAQLTNQADFISLMQTRFPNHFALWNHSSSSLVSAIDQNSYRAATIFFLAPQDRLLGVLRMRVWQFGSAGSTGVTIPYRFYEVSLARLVWKDIDPGPLENWALDDTRPNFLEDFSYRFVEDRRYPQNLIFPPTNVQLGDIEALTTSTTTGRNLLFRFSQPNEDYDPSTGGWGANTNAGVSRRQVSLTTTATSAVSWDLRTAVEEWHVMLPDPGIGQGEDRARLRRQSNFSAIIGSPSDVLDKAIRRQGKYGCIFKVFP